MVFSGTTTGRVDSLNSPYPLAADGPGVLHFG